MTGQSDKQSLENKSVLLSFDHSADLNITWPFIRADFVLAVEVLGAWNLLAQVLSTTNTGLQSALGPGLLSVSE